VRTDGAHNLDFSLFKNFAIGKESKNLRIEMSSRDRFRVRAFAE
jgi:hypothetical protein